MRILRSLVSIEDVGIASLRRNDGDTQEVRHRVRAACPQDLERSDRNNSLEVENVGIASLRQAATRPPYVAMTV